MPLLKRKHFELHPQKKQVSQNLLIAAVLVIGVIGAGAIITYNKPRNNSERAGEPSYDFAYLGAICSEGIINQDKLIQTIDAESTKITQTALSESQKLKDQATAYDNEQDAAYKQAAKGFYDAYTQGFISQEELDRRMDALGAVPQNITTSNTQSALARQSILKDSIAKVEANKKSIDIINQNRSKLSSCVDAVNNRMNFTALDIAEFKAITESSTIKP